MLGDQTLQGQPLDFFRPVQGTRWAQGAEHASVEIVELVMHHEMALGPAREYRHAERQEQIFQDAQVAFHSFPTDLTFASHLG